MEYIALFTGRIFGRKTVSLVTNKRLHFGRLAFSGKRAIGDNSVER